MATKHKYLIPMSSPEITEADRHAVMEVLNTPTLSMGPYIETFEQAICRYTGSQYAIGVSSGTTGLHLCVRAAGITSGNLVITTPFSFVSSANVILFENATPVFVDVEESTGNMDVSQTRQAVIDLAAGGKSAQRWLPSQGVNEEGKLKAVLIVDVFGQPADLNALRAIADEFQLKLIEDSCEALGAETRDTKAGRGGDYGVFAFYPNKQITAGEGGMVITDDKEAAELMRALRNQGRAPGDTWLQHTYLGYNYRMDEMSAALGLSQLQRLDKMIHRRGQVAQWYDQRLTQIAGIHPPMIAPTTKRVSWFVYVVQLTDNLDRDLLASLLENEGIPVRPYFLPIHLQPYMRERYGYQTGMYPITEKLGKNGLALPFSSIMSESQVDLVCTKLKKCISQL
jgi:dTDP-4-amino-4,6-dideoxygalactose transaminase